MSCAQNCNTNDAQIIFVTSDRRIFTFTLFSDSDEIITFDEDVNNINTKRDSRGNARRAGHDYTMRPFTIEIPCDDEAIRFDREWRNNPISMCGDMEVITGCCDDYSYESLVVTSVTAPSIGTEVGYFTIGFDGVVR